MFKTLTAEQAYAVMVTNSMYGKKGKHLFEAVASFTAIASSTGATARGLFIAKFMADHKDKDKKDAGRAYDDVWSHASKWGKANGYKIDKQGNIQPYTAEEQKADAEARKAQSAAKQAENDNKRKDEIQAQAEQLANDMMADALKEGRITRTVSNDELAAMTIMELQAILADYKAKVMFLETIIASKMSDTAVDITPESLPIAVGQ